MKKLFVLLTALFAVVAFSTASFAADQAQVTLTSPTIYKVGCEKAGSVTFAFDGDTVITAGDWWYFDLPAGVTLCKSYDYLMVGNDQVNPNVDLNTRQNDDFQGAIFANAGSLGNVVGGSIFTGTIDVDGNANGPVLMQSAGATDPTVTAATVAGNMAFLVKGTSGQQRITLYAVGSSPADTITVTTDFQLDVKIMDGKAWSDTAMVDMNGSAIVVDYDNDETYGEVALNNMSTANPNDEVIGQNDNDDADLREPNVENTLCIDASTYSGSLVFVSFASKSDKFTFTGDAQIAHAAPSGSLALIDCKGDESAEIGIGGQTQAACWVDYEDNGAAPAAASGYCENMDGDNDYFENRIVIESSTGSFGDIDDKYTLNAEITSPADGVYFSNFPALFGVESDESGCDDAFGAGSNVGAAFTAYVGADVAAAGYAPTTCTVPANRRVDSVVGTSGSAFELDGYTALYINFDQFAFDASMVAAGEEITVQVTLNRYPCGQIFQASRTIGTFITTCEAATATTLYFPWLPGSAAAGWWGGFVIVNYGDDAGTAALTYNDANGGTATYATGEIAAGAQWVDMLEVTASDLTDVDGYDATLNYSVQAVCGFDARGFVFTGNGTEGVGYTANGLNNLGSW